MTGWILFLYPFAEIYVFISFIDAYSFWDALLLTMGSGLIGLIIMMSQGRAALVSIQQDLAAGKNPNDRILHQLLILLGGLLIFLPGFINDIVGLLLVLPGTRHLMLYFFKSTLLRQITQGRIRVFNSGGGFGGGFSGFRRGPQGPHFDDRVERDAKVIDVTPIEITHEDKKPQDSE